MKSIMRSSLLLLALPFVVTASPVIDSKLTDFSGTWKNQRGSTLVLKKDGSNNFYRGTFTTAVAKNKNCVGKPVSTLGYSSQNALSITMNMSECGSSSVLNSTLLMEKDSSGKVVLDSNSTLLWSGKDNWDSRIYTHDTYEKVTN